MNSRFVKTPKLGVVLQVTDVSSAGADECTWIVHDVERNRGFKVVWNTSAVGRPPGAPGTDVDHAIGLAVERALLTPPEKVGGNVYDVAVTAEDATDGRR